MKTLMIPKQLWREVRELCSGKTEYDFDADALVDKLASLKTRNAAVGLMSSMRAIGLVDNANCLTDLGLKWANDASYANACHEMAMKYFPDETRNAIASNESSNEDIVARYAELEGMNIAGAKKNVRLLRMLLDDSSKSSPQASRDRAINPEEEAVDKPASHTASGSNRRPQKTKEKVSNKKATTASVNAKAQIEITVPLEKLSEVMIALFSVVSPDEVSTDLRFV